MRRIEELVEIIGRIIIGIVAICFMLTIALLVLKFFGGAGVLILILLALIVAAWFDDGYVM